MSTHYFPAARNALNLAFLPQEHLNGDVGRKRIEVGMRGVERYQVETIDGYGYVPSYGSYVDCSLLMIASYLGNTVIVKYWIEEFGVNPNIRTSTGRSALLMALQNGRKETVAYLLSNEKVEIGLPEAAAFRKKNILPSLINNYDKLSLEDKIFGLSGAEVAYIYSGLSGDNSWVQELMKKVDDPNIGGEIEIGSVLTTAVMSGNISLVEELLNEGIKYESLYNHDHILFYALPHVKMLEYLLNKIEEMQLQVVGLLDLQGRWRNNLLERCLIMRYEESVPFLLEKEPVEEWTAISNTIPLTQSLQAYNRPAINKQLVDSCISLWWVIKCAEQASSNGDIDLVRTLIEEKGCELSKTYNDSSSTTMLERATYSGSIPLVKYILEHEPYIAHFTHTNGYSHLVAAIQSDSVEIVKLLVEKFPEFLYRKIWNGESVIIVACTHLANSVVDLFLSPGFYSKYFKKGEFFDINHESDIKKTALWYAAQVGSVEIVDRILTGDKNGTFKSEEIKDLERVNELYIVATKSLKADKLHECFGKHNLILTSEISTSLFLTLVESKAIFSLENEHFLQSLIAKDIKFNNVADDEALLCSLIDKAPNWAIEQGVTIKIMRRYFDSSSAIQSHNIAQKVLKRCDHGVLEFLLSKANEKLHSIDVAQFILDLLVDGDILDSKNIPHFTLTRRREKCIRWFINAKKSVKSSSNTFSNKDLSFKVYRAILCTDMSIRNLSDEMITSGVLDPLEKLSDYQLASLLRIALTLCQMSNSKIISHILESRDQTISKILKANSDDESNPLVLTLEKSNKEIPDIRNLERIKMISWLLQCGMVDPKALGKKNKHPTMFPAKIGEYRSFKIIRDITHVSTFVEDEEGNNLVHYIIEGGDMNIIKKYCSRQMLEKICGKNGEYPVHVCAGKGNMAVLRYLIEVLNLNPWVTDSEKRTIFHYSALRGQNECLEYMKTLLGNEQKYEQNVDLESKDPSQISRLTVNRWLYEISQAIGKNISLDTNGICAFRYDDYTIVLEVKHESAYIYTTFDSIRFEIQEDSWELLLKAIRPAIHPCIYFSVDNALFSGSETLESNNLLAGLTLRVHEVDSESFRATLENFIEVVIETGKQLDVCVANRHLCNILLSTQSDKIAQQMPKSKDIAYILSRIDSFILSKPKDVKPMSDVNLQSFRRLLDNQFRKLKIAINKSISTDERGILGFQYEDMLIVLEPVSPILFGISAQITIGRIQPELRRNALLMNYLGQYTKGGVIKESNTKTAGISEIIYFHHDRIDLDFREFRNILENFIDTALKIRNLLPNYHNLLYKDKVSRKIESDLLNKGRVILNELSEQNLTFIDLIFAVKERERLLAHLESLGNLVAKTGRGDLWFYVATRIFARVDKDSDKDVELITDIQKQIFQSCLKYQFLNDDFVKMCLHELYSSSQILTGFVQKIFHCKELLQRGEMYNMLNRLSNVVNRLCEENGKTSPQIDTKQFNEYCEYVLLYARDTTNPTLAREAICCLEWIFQRKPIEANQTSALLLQTATTHNTKEIWYYLLMEMKPILSEEHFKFILNQNFTDRNAYDKMNGESIAIIEGIIHRMKVQREHNQKLITEGPEFYINLTFNYLQWNSNNVWEATVGDGEALSLVESALKMNEESFALKYRIPSKEMLSASRQDGALKGLCEECTGPGESNLLHITASKDSKAAVSLCQYLVEGLGLDFDKTLDGNGRSARTIAIANPNKEMQTWARSVGCFLGRYSIDRMVHKSATCVVYFATDESEITSNDETKVAIKILTKEKHFQSELRSRLRNPEEIKSSDDISPENDNRFDVSHVLPLIRYHDEVHRGRRWQCLVMPRAERNLDEVIRNEHICGNNINHIQFFAKEIASSLEHLHEKKAIHADFKPRNIVRLHGKYILIDFDSCTSIGEEYKSEKISTAYVSPDLASLKFRPKKTLNMLKSNRDKLKRRRKTLLLNDSDNDEDEIDYIGTQIKSLNSQIIQLESERQGMRTKSVKALPANDVWSFGCVMYTMLTKGLDLFKKDQSDNIVETEDKLRLANWKGLTTTELNRVLPLCDDQHEVEAAKDFLDKCLNANPSIRFHSMKQVLNHRFLKKVDESRVYDTLQRIRKEQSFRHVQIMSGIDDTKEALKEINNRISESSLKISLLLGSRNQLTCPNLAFLEKVSEKRNGVRLKHNYDLFFICAHSGEKVEYPIRLKVRKEWVKKAIPFLKAVVIALKVAGLSTGIPLPDILSTDEIQTSLNEEMLPAAFEKLSEIGGEASANFTEKEKDVIKLVGDGYALVQQKATEDSRWNEYMHRVTHNNNIIWVKIEYASLYQ